LRLWLAHGLPSLIFLASEHFPFGIGEVSYEAPQQLVTPVKCRLNKLRQSNPEHVDERLDLGGVDFLSIGQWRSRPVIARGLRPWFLVLIFSRVRLRRGLGQQMTDNLRNRITVSLPWFVSSSVA